VPDHATGQGVQQDNAGFGRLQTKATSSPSFYQYANGKGTRRTIVTRWSGFRRPPTKVIPSPGSISSCTPKAEACRRTMFVPTCGSVYRWHRGAKGGQDSRNGRAEDDPGSDKRSAEARTRLEASYATNSSLKERALRPVPQPATGQRRAANSAWNRCGTVGHIGS
jgi:hypothetical protein